MAVSSSPLVERVAALDLSEGPSLFPEAILEVLNDKQP